MLYALYQSTKEKILSVPVPEFILASKKHIGHICSLKTSTYKHKIKKNKNRTGVDK